MAILGQNIYIKSEGTIIAGTRSNELQADAELIEKSSPTSGRWREYLAGRNGMTITTNFLLLYSSSVLQLLQVGQTFTLQVQARGSQKALMTMQAILKTCKITATIGSLCQGSFQFQVTGEPMA